MTKSVNPKVTSPINREQNGTQSLSLITKSKSTKGNKNKLKINNKFLASRIPKV